jgi:hypothetical protein
MNIYLLGAPGILLITPIQEVTIMRIAGILITREEKPI